MDRRAILCRALLTCMLLGSVSWSLECRWNSLRSCVASAEDKLQCQQAAAIFQLELKKMRFLRNETLLHLRLLFLARTKSKISAVTLLGLRGMQKLRVGHPASFRCLRPHCSKQLFTKAFELLETALSTLFVME